MALTILDNIFIEKWKKYDFTDWNETDVREQFIAPLLDILGYAKGTVNNILREHSLTLSESYHRIGRQRVEIDYIPTIRLKTFWIIEAKPGNVKQMDFGDLLQAHLYAVHPEIQARFIVLINGWEIRLYDSLTIKAWDDPLYVCTQDNCETTFEGLKSILSADKMLSYQRARILEIIKATFDIELDEKELLSFQSDFRRTVSESLKTVKKNAREYSVLAWREAQKEELELLKATADNLLIIKMDIPIDGSLIVANEYIRRILEADAVNQSRLIDQVGKFYLGRPHAIFRVNTAYILGRLLEHKLELIPDAFIKNIPDFLKQVVASNFTYFEKNDVANALCHLDNASVRVAKKICLRFTMDILSKIVEQKKNLMAIEDMLKEQPTVAKYMIGLFGLMGESFWRMFCSLNNSNDIWNGIWMLERFEAVIEGLPAKKYPDNDSDLLFFEYYGKGFDMLCVGTWDVLRRCPAIPQSFDENNDIMKYAALSRDEVIELIPKASKPSEGWQPDEEMVKILTGVFSDTKK